jgi:hypothetical protein
MTYLYIQACVDMHCNAYNIALRVGNTSAAALHKMFLIPQKLHAGTNLLELKDKLDFTIKMTEH